MTAARTRCWRVSLLLALALATCGCRRLLHSNGVTIHALNRSSQFIRTIEVDYPGGSFGIAALRPGGTRSRWVRITASGQLKLDFVDETGDHRTAAALTLNPNDAGAITIEFGGNGKISFKDNRQAQGK